MVANKTYSFFGTMRYRFWRLWRAIFNKGMQVESKSPIKCVYYSLKFSNFLLCNTSSLTYFDWNGQQTRYRIPANKLRYKFWYYCDVRFQCMLAESKSLTKRFLIIILRLLINTVLPLISNPPHLPSPALI